MKGSGGVVVTESERFASPPYFITVVLGGKATQVAYEAGETVLAAALRAGLEPPFACDDGYCSCCMAKLTSGEVEMECETLAREFRDEGWILTCQARCAGRNVVIEYPD